MIIVSQNKISITNFDNVTTIEVNSLNDKKYNIKGIFILLTKKYRYSMLQEVKKKRETCEYIHEYCKRICRKGIQK